MKTQNCNGYPMLIAVLVSMLTSCTGHTDGAADATDNGCATVVLAKVTPQTLQKRLAVFGTVVVDGGHMIDVSVSYDTVVRRVLVRVGQTVKRGAVLLQLAPTAVAHTAYVQAQTAVAVARAAYDRSRRLLSEHLVTQADVEAAHKALLDAQAAFAAQRAQDSETLRATSDAVIAQVAVRDGQQIAAGTALLQLEPVQQRIAYVGVEPEALRDIRVGQRVELAAVFNLQQALTSTIVGIHAAINPSTRLVDVQVAIPKQEAAHWLSGEQLKGHIVLDERSEPAVPHSALLQDVGGSYLFRVNAGKAQKRYVVTDIETPDSIGVVKGIEVGDAVVTSGNYELQDGMSVREMH